MKTVEFGGLELVTSPHVMTPRETSSGLVALRGAAPRRRPPERVVDVGTGSGAIALAVARGRAERSVWATDVSEAAVELAALNARRAGLSDRIAVRRGDLLDPVPGIADVIVANLPYLPLDERAEHLDLLSEPAGALFADGDGLGIVRRLVAAARRRLAPRRVARAPGARTDPRRPARRTCRRSTRCWRSPREAPRRVPPAAAGARTAPRPRWRSSARGPSSR